MADVLHSRAHRFDALYQLLTGPARAKLPTPYNGSDHLRKDIGLPDRSGSRVDAASVASFPVDPFRYTLQGRLRS